jgi:drug/metabolite transporter (DMT)-like permease
MNIYLAAAGALTLLLGIAHTVIGEILIFRRLRRLNASPAANHLPPRHLAALWSSWHLLTVLSWGIGALFVWMAGHPRTAATTAVELIFTAIFLTSAIFWFFGTKGKHPAWLVFGLIAALLYVGSSLP